MQCILFEELPAVNGQLGLITLNRPEALNALDYEMFVQMKAQLLAWQDNPAIKAVIIHSSSPKAFCAGGDIRKIYQAYIEGKTPEQRFPFFQVEYEVDRLIYHFPKPYIALMQGIAMGGGLGVSVNGSYRVADPSLKLAMPEARIGYFPDVGASYFLSRCPGQIGMYLALTAKNIGLADAVYCGLVNYPITSLGEVINGLQRADWRENGFRVAHQVLAEFDPAIGESELSRWQESIDYCFSGNSFLEIQRKLEASTDKWATEQLVLIEQMSPYSLEKIVEQINCGKLLDFDACMDMEIKMALDFLENPDFFEGVRALIVDKDLKPRWKFSFPD